MTSGKGEGRTASTSGVIEALRAAAKAMARGASQGATLVGTEVRAVRVTTGRRRRLTTTTVARRETIGRRYLHSSAIGARHRGTTGRRRQGTVASTTSGAMVGVMPLSTEVSNPAAKGRAITVERGRGTTSTRTLAKVARASSSALRARLWGPLDVVPGHCRRPLARGESGVHMRPRCLTDCAAVATTTALPLLAHYFRLK